MIVFMSNESKLEEEECQEEDVPSHAHLLQLGIWGTIACVDHC